MMIIMIKFDYLHNIMFFEFLTVISSIKRIVITNFSLLQVRVLYVRNLTQDCSEEKLKESFEQYGKIERVKKIKDYAFIHFEDRDNAVRVSNIFNNVDV